MLNMIQMMTMRVEPPKPGIGRVHRIDKTPDIAPNRESSANFRKQQAAESDRRIIEAIGSKPKSATELADLLNMSETGIRKVLRRLYEAKRLEVIGRMRGGALWKVSKKK